MDRKQQFVESYEKLANEFSSKQPKYRQCWDPYPPNIKRVLNIIKPQSKVLDIGGWYKPFARANYVIDMNPYETRGLGGSIGETKEHFDQSTWIQMDVCSEPFPFDDKEFDFVYCGEILEDVRDPLRVCEEIIRVGKAGYIEVPSLWIECQYGIDVEPMTDFYPGFHKHRWLVEIKNNKILFIPKLIYLSTLKFLNDDIADEYKQRHSMWTSTLYWQDRFDYEEMQYPDTQTVISKLRTYFSNFDYSDIEVEQPTSK